MSDEQKQRLDDAKNGDIDSFEILIEGVKVKAFWLAMSYLKNEEDAKDALQESLLKIFIHLKNFNGEAQFSTWAYRIVVNTCLDMLKKEQKNKSKITTRFNPNDENKTTEMIMELPDETYQPDQVVLRKEKKEIIFACLDLLSDPLREVVIMRDVQGFSYGEIAEILAISEGTVKSRLSRGRTNLKKLFIRKMEQI